MTEKLKKLYPLTFESITVKQGWGTETYEVADLGIADSKVKGGWLKGNTLGELMETYMDRVTGDRAYNFYGRQFPLSVRELDVGGKLPLLVCPPDKVAEQRFDSLGKAKLWYVIDAEPDAKLVHGFSKGVTATEAYLMATGGGGGEPDGSMFNVLHPKKGDTLTINPGTVHCAFGEIKLLEIAEASALDIILWNWGDEMDMEDLGIVEALDFIDLGQAARSGESFSDPRQVALQEEFRIAKIRLDNPMRVFPSEADTFLLYSCIAGSAAIQHEIDGKAESHVLQSGETVLLPAEMKNAVILPREAGTMLLESTAGVMEEEENV